MDWQRVRIWGALGEVVKDPGNLAGRECKVKREQRQLWLMTNTCGVLVEVTDITSEHASVCSTSEAPSTPHLLRLRHHRGLSSSAKAVP